MENIIIKEVTNDKERKAFCLFPFEVYKNNTCWVPHFISDEIQSMMPEHNPAYEYCTAKFWMAYKSHKIVGRIGAIVNTLYNESKSLKMGRFTKFEVFDDIKITQALIQEAINWLKKKGMNEIQGPLGFTNLDQQGMLIEGYDYLASMGSSYAPPYYKKHMETLGFVKEVDWIEYYFKLEPSLPEKTKKVAALIEQRYQIKSFQFKSKHHLLSRADDILNLLSDTYKDLHGMTILTDKMKAYYSKKFLSILRPEHITAIDDKNGNMIGFFIMAPSLSKGLQKAKGKLLPFGWFHLLRTLKCTEIGEFLLVSVRKDYQNKGVTSLMMVKSHNSLTTKTNIKTIETTATLESNTKVYNSLERFNLQQHKRKRCWKKKI